LDYLAVRHLHVTCVFLSISLFTIRGGLEFVGVPWRDLRFLRIAPHFVDTVLLSAAIWLAVTSHQYPFVQNWLTAKVLALFVYVGLGAMALKPGRSFGVRLSCFFGALIAVSYIVGVALTRSPTWRLF
jgi:uncharacterized membrane protein SirB2